MSVQWSKKQQAVIDARGCSVLVSAAAGSGKTAVLVERLIQQLTDKKQPVEIERLLVVTFTNAAAAEMRERIGKGLDKKLQEEPENTEWIRQKLLLPCAQISTIHSLCLKTIREHFEVLELDPSFRLGDEAELKLLKADIAEDVMETYYASENRAFRDFVDRYASGKADQGIAEMMIQLYDYSRGFPWPGYWLKQCLAAYSGESEQNGAHAVTAFSMQQLKNMLSKYDSLLNQAGQLCLVPDGVEAYWPVIDADKAWLEQLAEAKDYDEAREILQQVTWKRLPRVSASVESKIKDRVKEMHADFKTAVENLRTGYFVQSQEELQKEMAYIYPSVKMLTELVTAFEQQFKAAKADRNMLDFSDLEHDMLRLLADFSEDENGRMRVTPTLVADELCEFYEEVVCDEYQDSNQVQELILSLLSRERKGQYNRFMVGDVKQSIYRFRLADAAIFMDKYHSYANAAEEEHMQRIDLSLNFRSRESVLSGINFIFQRIMKKSLGGIDYDEHAALYPGIEYPEAPGKHIAGAAEVLFLTADPENEDPDEELDTVSLEAKLAAARIRELTDTEHGLDIYDSDLGIYRKAGYKDIVILLRTVTGWAEKFVDVLTAENIPASAEMSAGFFDTIEIQTMLQFLSVVDNPKQDIPLAAVLCSPIVGMTAEELAVMRSANPEISLFDACTDCSEDMAGYDKIQKFLTLLRDIRRASVYMELYELIRYIYDQTGYYDYVQALPGGERRKANLDLLQERAVTYASGSYSGLFDFMRYIEQLKKNQIDFGEAAMPEGDKGRVQIMSIHKSKGLEYPIVILSGLGKKFNFKDSISKMILHSEAGIGMDAVNLQTRKKMASAYKKYLSSRLNLETLAEEQRILYVAMTRAKEKLIMTGADGSKKIEEKLDDWRRRGESAGAVFPDWMLTGAKSYLDWIMPAVLREDAGDDFIVRIVDIRELAGREVGRTIEKRWQKEELLERTTDPDQENETAKILDRDAGWQYPQIELLSVKGKYSVSELKKYAMEELMEAEELPDLTKEPEMPEGDEKLPDFMKDMNESEIKPGDNIGAFRGTAYHRALELIDFAGCPSERDEQWIRTQLSAMEAAGRLAGEQRKNIRVRDLADMIFSELGKRMTLADRRHQLRREAQFVMGVPVSAVHPEIKENETVLIQGIIDAYFEEEDGIVLLDYKTDRVSASDGAEILKKRYQRQLDDYQYALEQILAKKVKQKLIYSFALRTWIDF